MLVLERSEKLIDLDPECASELVCSLHARVPFAALDQAHIVPVQSGPLCELFLTKLDRSSASAHGPAKCFKIGVAAHPKRVAAL